MKLSIFTDGGARGNPGPAGIGIYVVDQNQQMVYEHSEFIGEQTNNVAEYQALQHAVRWIESFDSEESIESVDFFLDSKLVVEQVIGRWKIKQAHLLPYKNAIRAILDTLPYSWQIGYVPRAQNAQADALVNQALDAQTA